MTALLSAHVQARGRGIINLLQCVRAKLVTLVMAPLVGFLCLAAFFGVSSGRLTNQDTIHSRCWYFSIFYFHLDFHSILARYIVSRKKKLFDHEQHSRHVVCDAHRLRHLYCSALHATGIPAYGSYDSVLRTLQCYVGKKNKPVRKMIFSIIFMQVARYFDVITGIK